jgi:hypothetical protein
MWCCLEGAVPGGLPVTSLHNAPGEIHSDHTDLTAPRKRGYFAKFPHVSKSRLLGRHRFSGAITAARR